MFGCLGFYFFGVLFFSLPVEAEIRIDTSEDDLNSIAMAVSFKDGGRLEFVFLFQAPIFLVFSSQFVGTFPAQ